MPRCTPQGEYEKVQCLGSVCFCVNANGDEIAGTKVNLPARPNCTVAGSYLRWKEGVGNWVGNLYLKGTWDCFEGQGKLKDKKKMALYCNSGCYCSQVRHSCSDAPFLFVLGRILSLKTIPSAFGELIRGQFPARFVNGQCFSCSRFVGRASQPTNSAVW